VVKIAFEPSAEAPWKNAGLAPEPQVPEHGEPATETSVVVPAVPRRQLLAADEEDLVAAVDHAAVYRACIDVSVAASGGRARRRPGRDQRGRVRLQVADVDVGSGVFVGRGEPLPRREEDPVAGGVDGEELRGVSVVASGRPERGLARDVAEAFLEVADVDVALDVGVSGDELVGGAEDRDPPIFGDPLIVGVGAEGRGGGEQRGENRKTQDCAEFLLRRHLCSIGSHGWFA
jgi:hypothetical protein